MYPQGWLPLGVGKLVIVYMLKVYFETRVFRYSKLLEPVPFSQCFLQRNDLGESKKLNSVF